MTSAIIQFDKLFWLFFFFSFVGVLIEGGFCLISKKHWEAHVLVVWGWFNVLYGMGAVLFYVGAAKLPITSVPVKVLIMAVYATALEYIAGLMLKYGLDMRAWDYHDQFLNVDGIICPLFAAVWGVAAYFMNRGYLTLSRLMDPLTGSFMHVLAVALCIFLMVDFLLAALCMIRWSKRHHGYLPADRIDELIDRFAPDEWMEKRFMDWEFLDRKDTLPSFRRGPKVS